MRLSFHSETFLLRKLYVKILYDTYIKKKNKNYLYTLLIKLNFSYYDIKI